MTQDPLTVSAETPAVDALAKMTQAGHRAFSTTLATTFFPSTLTSSTLTSSSSTLTSSTLTSP